MLRNFILLKAKLDISRSQYSIVSPRLIILILELAGNVGRIETKRVCYFLKGNSVRHISPTYQYAKPHVYQQCDTDTQILERIHFNPYLNILNPISL